HATRNMVNDSRPTRRPISHSTDEAWTEWKLCLNVEIRRRVYLHASLRRSLYQLALVYKDWDCTANAALWYSLPSLDPGLRLLPDWVAETSAENGDLGPMAEGTASRAGGAKDHHGRAGIRVRPHIPTGVYSGELPAPLLAPLLPFLQHLKITQSLLLLPIIGLYFSVRASCACDTLEELAIEQKADELRPFIKWLLERCHLVPLIGFGHLQMLMLDIARGCDFCTNLESLGIAIGTRDAYSAWPVPSPRRVAMLHAGDSAIQDAYSIAAFLGATFPYLRDIVHCCPDARHEAEWCLVATKLGVSLNVQQLKQLLELDRKYADATKKLLDMLKEEEREQDALK
ncbi:hypothetical protein HDZ31DRAFT_78215, partial [Schizophyllum fasciatum]